MHGVVFCISKYLLLLNSVVNFISLSLLIWQSYLILRVAESNASNWNYLLYEASRNLQLNDVEN